MRIKRVEMSFLVNYYNSPTGHEINGPKNPESLTLPRNTISARAFNKSTIAAPK